MTQIEILERGLNFSVLRYKNKIIYAAHNTYNIYLSLEPFPTGKKLREINKSKYDEITMHYDEDYLIMSREIAQKYDFEIDKIKTNKSGQEFCYVKCPHFWWYTNHKINWDGLHQTFKYY
jgi:hypothetical protein